MKKFPIEKQKSFIRTGSAACLTIVFVLSGYQVSSIGTKEFARQLGFAVGATASVPENQYNKLASALSEKEKSLNLREEAILARETGADLSPRDTLFLSAFVSAAAFLSFLIGLNFYLDWKRERRT